ncbi:MAG: RluA family pseudouridine synthase [Rhodospirillales bacterium]|nr:RluA family pseudouridine synthase [Rhodospirillales bacterium]
MKVDRRLVTADEAEIRLDRWFRRHFPGVTQGAIERLCRTGQVRVDGRRAEGATRLAPGQAVRIPLLLPLLPPEPPPPHPDPAAARELARRILYRDASVLVLDKPAGLPVQGGPGITRHLDGMLDALRFEAAERPRLVHRLDQDTAGVLLLARSVAAAASLAKAFRGREVTKLYWAVVAGCPAPPAGKIDLPLVRTRNQRFGRTAAAADGKGARAVTEYRTRDHAGKRFAWLELSPLTGRTHQLRVHCAALGTPILGDVAYGGAEAMPAGFPPTLHLVARALALPHPEGGRLSVEAPLPPHMDETFRLLGFRAPPPVPPARR